jgi:molecular chaperone DnaJ
MAKRDYYEILGIDKSADDAAIKRAYRSMAMKYHPDKNPGDEQAVEKMKEINEAYAVLSDRKKRRLYDTYGHAGLEGYTTEDIFRGVDFDSLFREFGLGDFGFGKGFGFGSIFDNIFSSRRATTRERQRGADLRYDLEVTLEEVAAGCEKKVEVPRAQTCASCGGTGAKEGGMKSCERCGGSGQMVTEQRSGYSVFRQITTCPTCRGKGRIITEPCDECEGKGFVEKTRELTISIPKGADTGYRIRIEGEGEAGEEGAIPGDLYVVLDVKRHPIFERHGDDIYVTKGISFPQAALGGEIEDVPGLDGNLELDIPGGTQTGAILRIMDKGIPHPNGYGRGDEYVIIKVVTPTDLSEEEKELLRQFEKLRAGRNEG